MTKVTSRLVTGLALGAAVLLVPAVLAPTSAQAAQPGGFGDPVPPPTPTPPPPPAPAPAPAPDPVYSPTPTPPTTTTAPRSMDDDADEPDAPQAAASSSDETTTPRPEDMTLGFGFGYTLPADVQQISQASVRLRLVSGLTLEPIVRLATVGESLNDGDIKNANNEVTFGSNVRIPLKERGKVSLIGQIGAGVSFTIDDPDGSDNNTTTFAVALDWGAGVEWWFNQHWSLSVTGRNPFVSYVSTTQELGAGLDDKQSTTRIGAIWDPAIDIAVHLFY